MRTVFSGASVFDGARLHADAALVVEDGRVGGDRAADEAPAGERVRLDGGVLAPGFVDLQVNGGGGVMLNGAPTSTASGRSARRMPGSGRPGCCRR